MVPVERPIRPNANVNPVAYGSADPLPALLLADELAHGYVLVPRLRCDRSWS